MKYKFFLQSGRFNGLLQVWGENEIELTDTQEAQMQLDIETALDQHDALRRVAKAARAALGLFDDPPAGDTANIGKALEVPSQLREALAALDKIKEEK